jgi:hypothetical protein
MAVAFITRKYCRFPTDSFREMHSTTKGSACYKLAAFRCQSCKQGVANGDTGRRQRGAGRHQRGTQGVTQRGAQGVANGVTRRYRQGEEGQAPGVYISPFSLSIQSLQDKQCFHNSVYAYLSAARSAAMAALMR